MIIGVCGNIGAGKSTIIEILEKEAGYVPVYETVEENPYLADFYKDMKKWAFHSQLFFLIKRFDFLKRVDPLGGFILEDRTIDEDVEIFARNLHEMGYISDKDWNTYIELFKTFSDHLPKPSGLIYLNASLETLKEHVKRRGRTFENKISDDYLERLNALYSRWISNTTTPVLKIDCDSVDFVVSKKDRIEIIQKISKFANSLS
uniref:Deoxynucleoside kinase n=1 Tax=Mesoaciditoga lauensis TaxID=1495039 RepID=A0A7V3RFL7_9BACT